MSTHSDIMFLLLAPMFLSCSALHSPVTRTPHTSRDPLPARAFYLPGVAEKSIKLARDFLKVKRLISAYDMNLTILNKYLFISQDCEEYGNMCEICTLPAFWNVYCEMWTNLKSFLVLFRILRVEVQILANSLQVFKKKILYC